MRPSEVEQRLRTWFREENLDVRTQTNDRAEMHLLVRYPHGRNAHVFGVTIPRGRDLVAVSSVTRVDAGQQAMMADAIAEDPEEWREWMHETRMQLIRSGVDWSVHLGHAESGRTGPLQAFNVSEPIWFDGLDKNAIMQLLRKLWLAKLGVIHEVKFAFGAGSGEVGPVDDWIPKSSNGSEEAAPVEVDEAGTFGTGFDPSEWV